MDNNYWSFDINPLTQPENFQYAWLIYKDGALIEKTPFGDTSSRNYFFEDAGSYIFRIWIKNIATQEVFHSNIEQINISESNLSSDQMSANTTQFHISFSLEDTYQYAWYIYRNGLIYEKFWRYSDSPELAYTFIKNGYYEIKIFVKDESTGEKLFSSYFNPIRINCYQEKIMD